MTVRLSRTKMALRLGVLAGTALWANAAWSQVAEPKSAPAEQTAVRAHRPSFPYRVWYAGGDYGKNPDSYAHMTIDGSGRGNPRMKEARGQTHLNWVYGTQISWNAGPQYWVEHSGLGRRTVKPTATDPNPFIVSGISVDEWTGSTAEKKRWVVEGLREAKKQNPDIFVAMWVAGVDNNVAALAHEGVVDLIIVQAYNLTVQRGIGVGWQTALDRMDTAKKHGLESKTIMSFGHVTDLPNWKGGFVWTEENVRGRMAELKQRYPKMPGIAFFTSFDSKRGDAVAYDKLVQLFDRLSAEYWPDTLPLDATFSLTPQSETKQRLRAPKAEAGAAATVGESDRTAAEYWNFVPQEPGVYKIQAPYDQTLVLTAETLKNSRDMQALLRKDTGSTAQKWKLIKVKGGYTLTPMSSPSLRLTSNATQIRLSPASDAETQIWAANSEFLPPLP